MRTLAVDQSFTHCAYVIADGSKLESFDVWVSDKQDNIHVRAFKLAMKLIETIQLNKIERVVFEDLAFGARGDATRNLAGLLFVLIHTVLEYNTMYGLNIGMEVVPPTSLKKFATGSGKAEKTDMIKALPKDVAKQFTDAGYKKTTGMADLADAWFLSQWSKI